MSLKNVPKKRRACSPNTRRNEDCPWAYGRCCYCLLNGLPRPCSAQAHEGIQAADLAEVLRAADEADRRIEAHLRQWRRSGER